MMEGTFGDYSTSYYYYYYYLLGIKTHTKSNIKHKHNQNKTKTQGHMPRLKKVYQKTVTQRPSIPIPLVDDHENLLGEEQWIELLINDTIKHCEKLLPLKYCTFREGGSFSRSLSQALKAHNSMRQLSSNFHRFVSLCISQ